jgi:hypothetical protein
MINKIIAVITFLFSVIFFSYRKGKKDLKSDQIKNLVQDYETRKKADEKFNNRVVSDADREWLRQEWNKK